MISSVYQCAHLRWHMLLIWTTKLSLVELSYRFLWLILHVYALGFRVCIPDKIVNLCALIFSSSMNRSVRCWGGKLKLVKTPCSWFLTEFASVQWSVYIVCWKCQSIRHLDPTKDAGSRQRRKISCCHLNILLKRTSGCRVFASQQDRLACHAEELLLLCLANLLLLQLDNTNGPPIIHRNSARVQ